MRCNQRALRLPASYCRQQRSGARPPPGPGELRHASARSRRSLRDRGEAVLRPVVHHEHVVDKVEAVRLRLPRSAHHGLLPLVVQGRLRVDHLPGVPGLGDHKRHGEVVVLEELVPEVVPLDHPEVVEGVLPDGELQGRPDGLDVQELRAEVVPDEARAVVQLLRRGVGLIPHPHLEKDPLLARVEGTDLEAQEVDAVAVGGERAEEAIRRLRQRIDVIRRDRGHRPLRPRRPRLPQQKPAGTLEATAA
mmetsp:Transcript_115523/g.327366  ORF Transcript_115523/g.327366 Transcript_115523/m.327366 type:complete len:249 (+) Transcript_115523:68-814(+)